MGFTGLGVVICGEEIRCGDAEGNIAEGGMLDYLGIDYLEVC